jgi:hypothetical protein
MLNVVAGGWCGDHTRIFSGRTGEWLVSLFTIKWAKGRVDPRVLAVQGSKLTFRICEGPEGGCLSLISKYQEHWVCLNILFSPATAPYAMIRLSRIFRKLSYQAPWPSASGGTRSIYARYDALHFFMPISATSWGFGSTEIQVQTIPSNLGLAHLPYILIYQWQDLNSIFRIRVLYLLCLI